MIDKPVVETLDQAIAAYGGEAKMARAFQYSPNAKGAGDAIALWKVRKEAPRCHHIGLQHLGYAVSPKLFGVRRWSELPGFPSKRTKPMRRTKRKPLK